ncbi:MAG: NADH-quinone oxidoreductase subunit A [Candidatus Thorarchaeota archaeon]|nr:NADH-quinone oxidoreductase subunit A [Candidatus Thorarchaeota archaeon]
MRLFIDFIPVLLWAGLAAALVIIMLLTSWVLRPHILQNSEKTATYECGEDPIGPARISFPYSYITYTILFLVVDLMGAFLWLYAASTLRFSAVVVWQMVIFIGLFMVGIGYMLKHIPSTILSGSETLELWRRYKEEEAIEQEGRHH